MPPRRMEANQVGTTIAFTDAFGHRFGNICVVATFDGTIAAQYPDNRRIGIAFAQE